MPSGSRVPRFNAFGQNGIQYHLAKVGFLKFSLELGAKFVSPELKFLFPGHELKFSNRSFQ